MGFYIPNMEKPKNCAECFRILKCKAVPRWVTADDSIPKGCPLIEIDLVRCWECMYWHEHELYNTCDKHIGHGFPSDFFCGDGERRAE